MTSPVSTTTTQQVQTSSKQVQGQLFHASAYSIGDGYTSSQWGNITATGTRPTQGRTLSVDPNIIPLGTKVKITSDYPGVSGIYVAEDTGSGIKGSRVDIYFNSVNSALKFGRRDIQIQILN